MKKISILTASILVISLILVFISVETKAQRPSEFRKALVVSNKNYVRWFNEGKIDSLLTQYRDDACQVAKGCGKKFLHDYLKSETERYKFKDLSIISVSVSDTIAVEKGHWAINLNNGGGIFEGEYLTEWRFTGKKWLMVNNISDSK